MYCRSTCTADPQAHSFTCPTNLQVLYRHGLGMYNSAQHSWQLQMAVKTAAAQLHHDSRVLADAQGAFVTFVMKQLAQWGILYQKGGANTRLALRLARGWQPDISAAFAHLSRSHVSLEAVDAACDASDFCTDGLAMVTHASYQAAWRALAAGGTGLSDTLQHAKAQRSLGFLLTRGGKYEEAAAFSQSALDMCKRLLGDEHIEVASSINRLAGCIYF